MSAHNDIFELEAIGPLVILATWPNLMTDRLWLHFIDNTAAQASMVKGSSSVMSGDLLVGHTWDYIARRRVIPWFDRVDSKSNPVDGLSRGDRSGPWSRVQQARLPSALVRDLRQRQHG